MAKLFKPTFRSTFGKSFGTIAKEKRIERTGDKKPINRKLGVLDGVFQEPQRQLKRTKPSKNNNSRITERRERQQRILENKFNKKLQDTTISEIIKKLIKERNQGRENKFMDLFVKSNLLPTTIEYIKINSKTINELTRQDVIEIIKRTIKKI